MIRLEVYVRSRLLRPGPGQHFYIYQYNRLRFWENHPFTLAASYPGNHEDVDQQLTTQVNSSESGAADRKVQSETDIISKASSSDGPSSHTSLSLSSQEIKAKEPQIPAGQDKLVFFLRPFNGWTKRLRDECNRSGPDGVRNARILIEGPYGEKSPLASFENVIFIVGGTGIAGAIPYLQEHLRDSARDPSADAQVRATRTRDITVVWATKQAEMIRNVVAQELRPFLHQENIRFTFFATREKKTAAPATPEKLKETSTEPADVEIFHQRPNIREAVNGVVDRVNAAGSQGGKIAILTCGPAAMADEARAAAHRALKDGKQGLEYIEEAFG